MDFNDKILQTKNDRKKSSAKHICANKLELKILLICNYKTNYNYSDN